MNDTALLSYLRLACSASAVISLGVGCTTSPSSEIPCDVDSLVAQAACDVKYNVIEQWPGGYKASIVITPAAIVNGWTLTLKFPNDQAIQNLWNGRAIQNQDAVTVTNESWNSEAGPAKPVELGFVASFSGTGTPPAPTGFAVGGKACSGGGGGGGVATPKPPVDPPPPVATPEPSTGTPTTSDPSTPKGATRSSMATHFDGLGQPAGGCGVPEAVLDSADFVALNVQNTPGNYASDVSRPIPNASGIVGEFNNGLNCGRWVRVTIGDRCTAINDGAPNAGFCHGGTGNDWVADEYNGATLDMLVADSCQDGNGWCRDDRYHLDLSTSSLSRFTKGGKTLPNMDNGHWGNRKVSWNYISAPTYQGDIKIGFRDNAQVYWPAIVITHLQNGIHGVESLVDGVWKKATMSSDNGQVYVLPSGPRPFRIRVYDADDKLINGGREYEFGFPASCGERCGPAYTEATYRVVK